MMVLPKMIDLKDWAASMIIDFPNDDVPILDNEDSWKSWGEELKMCASFENIPSTYGYENYQDWANDVYYIMEG